MPRPINITDADLAYLERALDEGATFVEMARHIGCCVDTLKRILMRHDLMFFEGAKYVTPVSDSVVKWDRACSICGDRTPRPKWQYRCDRCTERQHDSASLPEQFLGS